MAAGSDWRGYSGALRYLASMNLRLVSGLLLRTGLIVAASGCRLGAQGAPSLDVLLSGGTVYDGSGRPGRITDVGIRGNRVVFVGPAPRGAKAVTRIDARGLIVSPGFIDPHTHAYEGLARLDSTGRQNASSLMQGITTVVLGADGRGPVRVAQTLGDAERAGLGTNVYALTGFGTVREMVMGTSSAAASRVQLDSMRALVTAAMREGAFGVGSGLFYAPQSYATTEEVIAVVSAAKPFGGVYDTHQRDESSYTIGLLNSVRESIRIGCESGLTTNIGHIKALGVDVWGKADSVLGIMRAARARGCKVVADQYPWTASGTALSATLLPRWAQAGGRDSLRARIADAAQRTRMLVEMRENLRRRGGDSSILLTSGSADTKTLVGKTLKEVAAARQLPAVEAALEIIRDHGDMGVASFNMTEADIATFMRDPFVMTSSDGSEGHPRLFGTYPRKIRRYVLERRVITMQRMVQASSAQVAETYGLTDRGVLRSGAFGDVIVFDPATIRDEATYVEPTTLAIGMRWVFVNGQAAVTNGVVTGVMAGRGLRHPRAAAASSESRPDEAAAAPQRADARVTEAAESIVALDLMRDVSYLASDALAGRATFSPGLDTAAEFVIRRLRQLGVRPVGDSGSYRQHYSVVMASLDTARMTLSIGSRRFSWGDDFLVTQFRVPSAIQGGVVYVGHGLRSARRGLDPYAGVSVRGQWLLVHASQIRPSGTADTLGVYGVDYTTAYDEARARGARGLLLIPGISERANWPTLRSRVMRSRDVEPSMGRAGAPFPLPVLLLSDAVVTALLDGEAISGAEVLGADSSQRALRSVALKGTVTATLGGTTLRQRAYNIVGVVDGADTRLRDEWISVSTHLDGAVGAATTSSGDSIYNAADDNGTGSAGNLSIARAVLRGPRPRRSILFIWDSGEEVGLLGTRFLAYGPLASKVVAHFTVDMIGRTKLPGTMIAGQQELTGPGEVFVSGPGVLSTVLDSALATVTRAYPYVRFDRRYEDPQHEFFYPRTDAAPYIEQGIPYAEFFTGLHEDYHAQTDEVSKLDLVKFEAVARSVYATLWIVANGSARPRIDKPIPSVLWFMTPR